MPASHASGYEYQISDCDVVDKQNLQRFRDFRDKSLNFLRHDEHHSIFDQIYGMMWNDAVYRSFNEARRFQSKENPNASSNGMLGEFLDQGYVSFQVFAICRLIDKPAKTPKRGTVSLPTVIQHMRDNRDLITREAYICYDGLPYDFDRVRREFYASIPPGELCKPRWLPTQGPQAFDTSEIVHEHFDALSNRNKDERQRDDKIEATIFDKIESLLENSVFDEIKSIRDKKLAHAADAVSRGHNTYWMSELTLNKIRRAQETLVQVTNLIGSGVLWECGLGKPVPYPQFDQFEHLDNCMIPSEKMDEIQQFWSRNSGEREEWQIGIKELLSPIPTSGTIENE